jgi:hypothetical protein
MPAPLSADETLRRLRAHFAHRQADPKAALAASARALGMRPDTFRGWLAGIDDPEATLAHLERAADVARESPVEPGRIALMLRAGATLEDMMRRTGASAGQALDEIEALKAGGLHVVRRGDVWTVSRAMPVGEAAHLTFRTDADNRFRFLAVGDKHVASKYHRPDVLRALYAEAADRGYAVAIDTGNYIEGEASFNRHDLAAHGLDNQARMLAQDHPAADGLVTYAVTGDDHEGWYSQREGVDVGRYVEGAFRAAGRSDWINLGYMEAFVEIENANTGARTRGLVMHPGGGAAYATSYRPQKIVESFEGGEKPGFVLIGHYHKLSLNLIRQVWAVQTGTCQDQTPFMRKKGIDAHIGGVFVELEQDPETGFLLGCTATIRRFHNRSSVNGRWSHSGPVTLPVRTLGA